MTSLLVVDDDKILTMILEAKLAGTSVDVISTFNAIEALKIVCSSIKPDLILLDLNMPKVSGLDLLETIKNNPESQNIPVIIISSSKNPEKLERALKLGALDIISKPIDSTELHEKVFSVLQQEQNS